MNQLKLLDIVEYRGDNKALFLSIVYKTSYASDLWLISEYLSPGASNHRNRGTLLS